MASIDNDSYFYDIQANLAFAVAELPFKREAMKVAKEQFNQGLIGNTVTQDREYFEKLKLIRDLLNLLNS
jgi:hypothetical protein